MRATIVGDNFVILTGQGSMTMTKTNQAQSYHWFLLPGMQRLFVDIYVSQADILSMPIIAFVPSKEESGSLENDTIYHITKTATIYISALTDVKSCIQPYIKYHYLEESCKR